MKTKLEKAFSHTPKLEKVIFSTLTQYRMNFLTLFSGVARL